MKITKRRILIMGGIFSISGLGLMFASADKDLSMDLNNAIQHIEKVKIISTGTDNTEATLQNQNQLVQIETDTFILSRTGDSKNILQQGSKRSTILGGFKNKINGTRNVILGGSGNEIMGTYNTILGGEGNKIVLPGGSKGSYSTILGGKGNTIISGSDSVIVGSDNTIYGSYSVVAGKDSHVTGDNSAALGSNSNVKANNSFLWTDGQHGTESLNADNVFAVVADSGMVINSATAHRFAKLTIGGPMVLVENSGANIACGGGQGGGILKAVSNKSNPNQICLCSCDGTKRNSMFDKGKCRSTCDEEIKPECGTEVVKSCENQQFFYSGSCASGGKIVEGTGAYFLDKNGKLHWSCQSDDGSVIACSGSISSVNTGSCGQARRHLCTGLITGAAWINSGWTQTYNWNIRSWEPTTQPQPTYTGNSDKPCSYQCKQNYTWNPTSETCEANTQTGQCTGLPENAEWVNGGTFIQTWNGSEWTPGNVEISYWDGNNTKPCSYKCNTGYDWDGSSCVLGTGSCGPKPTGSGYKFGTGIYTYGYTPTSWTYTGGTLGPCLYKCDSGYSWNSTTKKCDIIEYKCTTDKSTLPGYIFTLKNPMSQSEEKPWTHIADGTAQSSLNACEFTCDLNNNYYYNSNFSKCERKTDWCDNEVVNGCQSPATGANKNSSDPSKYTWDCAINGVPMEEGCFRCKDGYVKQPDGTCVLEEPESTGHWACKKDYNISGTCRNIGKTAWCNLHVPRDLCVIQVYHDEPVSMKGNCLMCYQNNSSCNCNVPPNKPIPECCATNQIEMSCNSYDLASECNRQHFCDRTYEENNDFDYICVDDQGNQLEDWYCERECEDEFGNLYDCSEKPDNCSENFIDDGLIPKCGGALDECEIGDVENISSSTKTWDCVNGGESVTCEYSCSTKSVCPTGYKEENGVCKLNYRICAKTLLKTNCPIAEGWDINPYTLSSTSCFGNKEQGYLSPGQNVGSFPGTINVQNYGNYYYGYSNNLCFSLDGGPQLGEECDQKSANVFMEGGIFDVCGINSMKKYGNDGDNGYYIDVCPNKEELETVDHCQVEDKCNVVTLF